MIILGVDPSTSRTGYSILAFDGEHLIEILRYGELDLRKYKTMPQKIDAFHKHFKYIIDHYKVELLAIETPFMGRNAKTFLKLGCLKGILYLLGLELTILEFSPTEVKKMVGGQGNLSKEELAHTLIDYGIDASECSTDVTDAIAIGLCAVLTLQMN